jgi:hypothetical protein
MEKPSEHIFNEKNKSLDSHSQGYLAWGFPSPKLVKRRKIVGSFHAPPEACSKGRIPGTPHVGCQFPWNIP